MTGRSTHQNFRIPQQTKGAVRTPTLKPKEEYGRLSHTLSAASLIGGVTVMITETHTTAYVVAKIGALDFWGVLLLWVGAVLSKGE